MNIQIADQSFTLKVKDTEKLKKASEWLKVKIQKLVKRYPLKKPHEVYLLLLLELAYERFELIEEGKALLKNTDQLVEWIEIRLE